MGLSGDAIVQFDWSVGQIMSTLEKLGIADNTLILLTAPWLTMDTKTVPKSCLMAMSLLDHGVATSTVRSREAPACRLSCAGQAR